MEADNKKYFIYKYEWDDGSVYIGQSHIGANRYGRISAYKTSPKVYRKMKSNPNFSKEILRDCLTELEVDDFEKYYIKQYNSLSDDNPKGLNLDSGGSKNKTVSLETRKKHSEKNYFKNNPDKSIRLYGERNPFYNQKHTDESKKKMSENHFDVSGSNNPRARAVIQYDLDNNFIKTYPSGKTASDETGIGRRSINDCCRGVQKTAGGFIWRYE